MRAGWAAVVAAVGLGLAAPSAGAAPTAEIVSWINAQRAAHGIPAGIVENPAISDACAKHNAYSARNQLSPQQQVSHSEDPALPGYTPEGDQAARKGVLFKDQHWTADSNPFEIGPLHLHQLLEPRLDVMGADESRGYGCATTQWSLNRPAPPGFVTYTYPGNGAQGWSTDMVAVELPFTPGEKVGIPQGTRTGPYLYVLFDGPGVFPRWAPGPKALSASLTGPEGAVPITVVDAHTPGLENYLPMGPELIPRQSLQPESTYVATISASVPVADQSSPTGLRQVQFDYQWSFRTGPATARLRRAIRPRLPRRPRGRRVTFTVPRAAVGHSGKVAVQAYSRRKQGKLRWTFIERLKRRNTVRLPRRRRGLPFVSVRAFAGPFVAADGTHYPPAQRARGYRSPR